MLPSMRRLIPVALLLTSAGALADSPLPGADAPAKEIVTRTPVEAKKADEQLQALTREVQALDADVQQLQALTREVQALDADVQQLQAKVTERQLREVEYLDQTDHKLWP